MTKILKNMNESLISLRNSLSVKAINGNENQKKIVHIVEKIVDFNK